MAARLWRGSWRVSSARSVTTTASPAVTRAGHDGGGRFGAGSDDQVVAVAQPKPRAFDLEQRRRRIHDEIENLPALLDGREPAGDVVENLEAAALAILCAVRMRRRRAFGHWMRSGDKVPASRAPPELINESGNLSRPVPRRRGRDGTEPPICPRRV